MKIRMGFVSNSSSSSFCIYGAELSDVLEELKKALGMDLTSDCDDVYSLSEAIESKTGLELHTVMGECLYIGRSYTSIKDDETGRQLKDDVEAKLKQLLGRDVPCSSLSEAWYDG